MGCDIYCYIEIVSQYDELTYARSFAKVNVSRDYILFGHLAGIRSHAKAVSQPKGIPVDAGQVVFSEYYLLIVETESEVEENKLKGAMRVCSRESADLAIAHGSKKINRHGFEYVEDLDLHTPSYLSIEELEEVNKLYATSIVKEIYISYVRCGEVPCTKFFMKRYGNKQLTSIIAMMKCLEDNETKTRLVFWFDS
jgi:hypothetical protein